MKGVRLITKQSRVPREGFKAATDAEVRAAWRLQSLESLIQQRRLKYAAGLVSQPFPQLQAVLQPHTQLPSA
eukprot:2109043-Lingulodinium_polyedra.AAC.1